MNTKTNTKTKSPAELLAIAVEIGESVREAATNRAERAKLAVAEDKALRAWIAAGSKGKRPATPNMVSIMDDIKTANVTREGTRKVTKAAKAANRTSTPAGPRGGVGRDGTRRVQPSAADYVEMAQMITDKPTIGASPLWLHFRAKGVTVAAIVDGAKAPYSLEYIGKRMAAAGHDAALIADLKPTAQPAAAETPLPVSQKRTRKTVEAPAPVETPKPKRAAKAAPAPEPVATKAPRAPRGVRKAKTA